jgi:hypothetical protein
MFSRWWQANRERDEGMAALSCATDPRSTKGAVWQPRGYRKLAARRRLHETPRGIGRLRERHSPRRR